jgi:nitrilase
MNNNLRVAVVQASPVHFNRERTVEKCRDLVGEASKQSPGLIVFPESFIPAYPRGLSFGTVVGSRSEKGKDTWEIYFNNAVEVPGKEVSILEEISKKTKAYISIGVTEKAGKSLYCTQLFISPYKGLLGKHRKIKPTAAERIIWAEGDASTLTTFKTPFGTAGTLICWENFMPLARMAMYSKGVTIFIAPTADTRDTWQTAIRHIAYEGKCFVISCNQFSRYEDYPREIRDAEGSQNVSGIISSGNSAVVSPAGDYIAGPVSGREEIIFADLDLSLVGRGSFELDVTGHYNRPDIFKFSLEGVPETIEG